MIIKARVVGLETNYDGLNSIKLAYEPDGDTLSTLTICVGYKSLSQFYLGGEVNITLETA